MFNEGGRTAELLSFANSSFVNQNGGFTYNDSPYVHALNRTLQLEQAAIDVYAALLGRAKDQWDLLIERTDGHHNAHRQLVRIIFSQRGLPDTKPVSFTAVASTFAAKASKWMPLPVKTPLLGASAARLEQSLVDRYVELLNLAPEADQMILTELCQQARDFSSEHI